MNISRLFLLLSFLITNITIHSRENNEISTIRRNFHKIYIENKSDDFGLAGTLEANQPGYDSGDRVIVELQQMVPYSYVRIESYLKNLKENGEWTDINYQDNNRSGWEPRLHAERLYELVVAFLNTDSKHYKSPQVENAIHSAMKFWFDSKLTSSNWWYNQIGPQRTFGTAFVLFKDYMSESEIDNAIEILAASKFGMTGQNKVWLAANVMMRGILQNDIELVKQAREEIVSEITLGNKEGIKDDWCFHQHGAQQQFGNYGLAYIYTMSIMSGILSETSMAFNKSQLDIIASLIEKGYQWIIWNGRMDINALGRQLFVSAPIHKALGVAFAAAELGGNDKDCKRTAETVLNNCFTDHNNLTGVYHFWQSDYTICRRNSWMASLKMASSRVLGAESMNGDNMKGYYMADGAMYLYKSGNEYLDIFPLLDWRKLPGTTCYETDAPMPLLRKSYYPRNMEDFVGGLSDGNSGISTINIDRDGLKARKSYIFDDSIILCLGTGINSDSTLNVTTSVEQCWYNEDFKIAGNSSTITKNKYQAEDIRILHNNTGYILWNNNDSCIVKKEHRKGNINEIMQMQDDRETEGDIFSIYIDHGKKPVDASYCYAIIPDTDYKSLEEFKISDIKILCNNPSIQSVWIERNETCWASVKAPAKLKVKDGLTIEFEQPGLYKFAHKGKQTEIICCDPTQKQDCLSIKVNGKRYSANLPKGGISGTSVKLICK